MNLYSVQNEYIKWTLDLQKMIDEFIFTFLPFLHGVHPYAFATEKQLKGMKEAKVKYKILASFELLVPNLLNQQNPPFY